MNRSTVKKIGRRKAGTRGRTAKATGKRIANKATRYLPLYEIVRGRYIDQWA